MSTLGQFEYQCFSHDYLPAKPVPGDSAVKLGPDPHQETYNKLMTEFRHLEHAGKETLKAVEHTQPALSSEHGVALPGYPVGQGFGFPASQKPEPAAPNYPLWKQPNNVLDWGVNPGAPAAASAIAAIKTPGALLFKAGTGAAATAGTCHVGKHLGFEQFR